MEFVCINQKYEGLRCSAIIFAVSRFNNFQADFDSCAELIIPWVVQWLKPMVSWWERGFPWGTSKVWRTDADSESARFIEFPINYVLTTSPFGGFENQIHPVIPAPCGADIGTFKNRADVRNLGAVAKIKQTPTA
jgi:hypothetical protein